MPGSLLYKYVSVSILKHILGGSIRMTQPGAFNDPFELLPEIVVRRDQTEKRLDLAFDFLAPRRTDSTQAVVLTSDELVASDFTSRTILDELNKQVGILCLSKSHNSILMWSHYADQYKGAVVAFDGNHEFFQSQISVEYVSERPRRHIDSYGSEPIPLAELCAKSLDWEYEQEVRLIRSLRDCDRTEQPDARGFPIFVMKIPREAIVTVALGERTPVAQQKEIYNLLRETKIGLTLSAVDNVGYGFRQELVLYAGEFRSPRISPRTAHIFAGTDSPLAEVAQRMIDSHPLSQFVNKLA